MCPDPLQHLIDDQQLGRILFRHVCLQQIEQAVYNLHCKAPVRGDESGRTHRDGKRGCRLGEVGMIDWVSQSVFLLDDAQVRIAPGKGFDPGAPSSIMRNPPLGDGGAMLVGHRLVISGQPMASNYVPA